MGFLWFCHRNRIIHGALSCISRDSVTGIVSSTVRFHAYPVTLSQESCHPWGALLYIPQHIVLCIESTKILDIGRNFSYFLKLQYESRRLSSYLLKVNIDRTWARLEDGRTDGRNIFRPRNHETRRDEVENFGRLFGRLSSYRRTIANPDLESQKRLVDTPNEISDVDISNLVTINDVFSFV